MLHGNFALLQIKEEETRFVISQSRWGTCDRQLLCGRYGPPLDVAVVAGPHPVTLGRRTIPIYRTHVAVFHSCCRW